MARDNLDVEDVVGKDDEDEEEDCDEAQKVDNLHHNMVSR